MTGDTDTTADDDRGRRLTKRQAYALIIVGVAIGLVAVPAIGAVLEPEPDLSNNASVNGPVVLAASDGPRMNLTEDGQYNLTNFAPENDTLRVWSTAGNVTFEANGTVNATVDDLTGNWTTLTGMEMNGNALTIVAEDKQRTKVMGDVENLSVAHVNPDDGEPDLIYGGDGGSMTIVLYGAEPRTGYKLVDSQGDLLGEGVSDNNGVLRLSNLSLSSHVGSLQEQEPSDKAPYFDDATVDSPADEHLNGSTDGSLDDIVGMATQLGGYVIGGGGTGQGLPNAGVLVLGLTVSGTLLAALLGAGVGTVGGGVAITMIVAGLVQTGLAPEWLWAMILIGIGLVVATATIRVVQ